MLTRLRRWLLAEIRNPILERIELMGTTISQAQDANTAAITADLATIKEGVTALQAQLAAAQATAGETITQAQEDALTQARATADGLAAVFAPPAPATPGA